MCSVWLLCLLSDAFFSITGSKIVGLYASTGKHAQSWTDLGEGTVSSGPHHLAWRQEGGPAGRGIELVYRLIEFLCIAQHFTQCMEVKDDAQFFWYFPACSLSYWSNRFFDHCDPKWPILAFAVSAPPETAVWNSRQMFVCQMQLVLFSVGHFLDTMCFDNISREKCCLSREINSGCLNQFLCVVRSSDVTYDAGCRFIKTITKDVVGRCCAVTLDHGSCLQHHCCGNLS